MTWRATAPGPKGRPKTWGAQPHTPLPQAAARTTEVAILEASVSELRRTRVSNPPSEVSWG